MNRPLAPYVLLGSTLIATTIGTPALADQDDGPLLVVSRIQYVTDLTPRPESFPLI